MHASLTLPPIRFLQKCETDGLNQERCWKWLGPKNSNGYGRFVNKNRHILAHRASYEMFVGDIPKDKVVCHSCDNRLCVNPHHLWLGTQSENLKDAIAKSRMTPPSTRGAANGNAKLRACDVAVIREMHSGGQRNAIIAKAFGVSQSTIGNIINRLTWKD